MIGPIVFLAIAGVFLLALPRRYAAIPLLLAAVYTGAQPGAGTWPGQSQRASSSRHHRRGSRARAR